MLRRGLRPERLGRARSLCAPPRPRPRQRLAKQPGVSPPTVSSLCSVGRAFRASPGSADAGAPDWRGSSFPALGDTIYALSTAAGPAGIAVIRISGPACSNVYRALCPSRPLPRPRHAAVRTLFDPQPPAGQDAAAGVLDSEALVLYFPAPQTVTGEDVMELHVHGGPATVRAVLAAVPRCRAAQPIRYAEPGEFTKRAFINGRLDLARVEALSDVLAAETEQQRRAAVRGNSGALGRTYEAWRQQLLLARGEIEALIDFSEDQHFDEPQDQLLNNVTRQVHEMLHSIGQHELGSQRSELLRSGIRIALLGPPNVGKSSLMNLIVGREASIVSGEAGTTRDIVEASLDIRGYLCCFADTAGFRPREPGIGAVEEEGIRRARLRAQDSDIVMVLGSVETGPDGPRIHYDQETLQLAAEADACLVVVNKRDSVRRETLATLLSELRTKLRQSSPQLATAQPLTISCKQGQAASLGSTDAGGIQGLMGCLGETFARMTDMPAHLRDLLGVTERQRQLLASCRQHLEAFVAEARPGEDDVAADVVLAAERLRFAADCLARLTGKGEAGDVEDVLGVVFERFCVGK